MRKRISAALILAFLLVSFAAPVRTTAAPKWWGRFKEIVLADVDGALAGFVQTESIGGAIAGGIMGSVAAAADAGIPIGDWRPEGEVLESIGLHHNLGLAHLGRDKSTPWLWEPKTQETLWPAGWTSKVFDSVAKYLESSGIRVGKEQAEPLETSPYVSANFIANLTKAKAILNEETENPQDLLNRSIAFMLNASLKETDPDLRDEIVSKAQDYNSSRSNKARGMFYPGDLTSPLDFGKIEITYKEQKAMGQPVDIILAWIYADVLQSSSVYWSDVYCWGEVISGSREQSVDGNGTLWCWGANFADIGVRKDEGTLLDSMDIIILVPKRSEIKLTINSPVAMVGEREVALDVAPLITGGRTMVPFRFIGEALGAEIDWIQDSAMVTYLRETPEGTVSIEMVIGRSRAMVNGVSVPIDSTNSSVVPVIVSGRTLVPVRFISEALGFQVDWIQESGEVVIGDGK